MTDPRSPRLMPTATIGVVLLVAVLLVGTVAGGGSALYPIPRLFAEIAALPLLGIALARTSWVRAWQADRWALALLGAMVTLVVIQLVPLSPALWSGLPGRELAVTGDRLMFGMLPSRPISLDPEATIRAVLMLVPAIALYLYARSAALPRQLLLAAALVGCALVSLLLGLIQFASGQAPWTHFYHDAQSVFSTGVFANRNHQAVLLAVAIPMLAGCLASGPVAARHPPRIRLFVFLCGGALFAIGALITASRTGAALLVPAIAGGLAIVTELRFGERRRLMWWGVSIVAVVVVLGVVLAQAGGPLAAFADRSLGGDDARLRFWPQVVVVLKQYLPVGSGFGTFRPVYDAAEPLALTGTLYINHAHDDWMEIVLEGGVPALLLLVAFLGWVGAATVRAWRASIDGESAALRRAGSIVVLCLLLHSIVDYPLRTIAVSLPFAFAAALLSPSVVPNAPRASWTPSLGAAATALVLGFFVVMSNLGAYLARSNDPGLATGFTLARGLPNAFYALALAGRGERDETVTYPAARAIRSSPTHWQAFRAAELAMSDPRLQTRLEAQTLAWTRRDPVMVLAAYRHRLAAGDMAGAADMADAYFRLPEADNAVIQSIAAQLRDPRFAAAMIPHLAAQPGWRGRFVALLSPDLHDAPGYFALWHQLALARAPIPREEALALLSRYAMEGAAGRAIGARLWLTYYAPGHDPAALVADVPLPPYDWSIVSGMEDRAALLGGRVDIDVPAGSMRPILQKVVALPAGQYRLTADSGLPADALGWSLTCDGTTLSAESLTVSIATPSCATQMLTLFASGGTGSIAALSLRRIG